MENARRKILKGLAAAAASGAVPVRAQETASQPESCQDERAGASAARFPNVVVYTHEGRKARFYDDLIKNRTCLINFMSVRGDAVYPVTGNLIKVQELLGPRLGSDVFMYSITTDPEQDTPRVLRAFAEKSGARPGWLFLTAPPEAMSELKSRLFLAAGTPGHAHLGHEGEYGDCSVGLTRYGNDQAGVRGSVPTRTDPRWIIERLSWVENQDLPSGPPRRKGPPAVFG